MADKKQDKKDTGKKRLKLINQIELNPEINDQDDPGTDYETFESADFNTNPHPKPTLKQRLVLRKKMKIKQYRTDDD